MKGHIRTRGKSTWQLVYEVPRDAGGRRQQGRKTVHGSKKAAEARLREILTSLDRGNYITPSQETVGAFLKRWLETYAATNTSLRTQEGYRERVRLYLIPTLGAIPLNALRPDHVQELYADLLERRLSPRTVLGAHRVLRQALAHGVKWGLIARNVCDAVDAPRPERKDMVALDTDKVARFLAACEVSRYKEVFLIALYTGLRRSEVLALKWDNVNLDESTLNIVAGLQRLPGKGLVLLPLKTKGSRRQLAITKVEVDTLRAVRGAQMVSQVELGPVWQDMGFVFAKADGRPLDPEKVSKEFARVSTTAGLSGVRLHDLRHTHASLMLQAGVHPKIVSERLGHANISVTMDTYSHVLPGLQEDAAERFAKLLDRPSR